MLHTSAFANALALLTALFYIVLLLLNKVTPQLFRFLFNAQFLGANIASLLPKELSLGNFIGTLLALTLTAWVLGYLWALFYNRFAK